METENQIQPKPILTIEIVVREDGSVAVPSFTVPTAVVPSLIDAFLYHAKDLNLKLAKGASNAG